MAEPLAFGLSDPASQPKFAELVPNALDPGFFFGSQPCFLIGLLSLSLFLSQPFFFSFQPGCFFSRQTGLFLGLFDCPLGARFRLGDDFFRFSAPAGNPFVAQALDQILNPGRDLKRWVFIAHDISP